LEYEEDEPVVENGAQVDVSVSQLLHPHEELLQKFRKQAKLLREVEDEVDIRMFLFFFFLFSFFFFVSVLSPKSNILLCHLYKLIRAWHGISKKN
jgi:hypothetical protein